MSFVAWFAGLFYLPRLFVYHVNAPKEAQAMLCTMERKLYYYITTPAMIATWLCGITLIMMNAALLSSGWLHAKLALVLVLSGYHGTMKKHVKAFAEGRNTRSERYFRIYNEFPTLVLVVVVMLAVLKPF